MSQSCKIGSLNYHIVLKFDRCIGNTAAKEPVKFESNGTILNTYLTVLRLCEVLQWYNV